jgi:hypothetical protein
MTDWFNDLKNLNLLYADPVGMKPKDAQSVVFGFLIHAVPHLMAAARLLEGRDITHPFKFPWEKDYH